MPRCTHGVLPFARLKDAQPQFLDLVFCNQVRNRVLAVIGIEKAVKEHAQGASA
jgi:hypothetical protein